MLLTIVSLIVDAGVAAPGSGAYPYFVAAQCGLASALCTCLMINGFVGFQLYEDGTTLSVWLLRLSSLAMFIISGAVSLLTFKKWAGMDPEHPVGVFVMTYIVNAIQLFVYVASQILLVVGTLEDRWPLGDILFGVFFFVIGQICLYVFSETICDQVQHYLDGLFFATICNLLGVMMVYKVSFPDPGCSIFPVPLTAKNSTGTPSHAKISSSQSVSSSTTGKSRNFSQRKISAAPSTPKPNTLLQSTNLTIAPRTTQPLVTNHFFLAFVVNGYEIPLLFIRLGLIAWHGVRARIHEGLGLFSLVRAGVCVCCWIGRSKNTK